LAAAGALAVVGFGSTALADSVSVDFNSFNVDPNTHVVTGIQTTTTSLGGVYDGIYSAVGTLGQDGCVSNANTSLDFPVTGPKTSHLSLVVQKLCFNSGPAGTFTVQPGGTGVFAGANGGGTATYTAPDTVNFVEDLIKFPKGFLDPSPVAGSTPELDSLILFGTGSLGLGGYALMRLRARRKRPSV
jgi:hypothetical protein